jgi:hypothetical protein
LLSLAVLDHPIDEWPSAYGQFNSLEVISVGESNLRLLNRCLIPSPMIFQFSFRGGHLALSVSDCTQSNGTKMPSHGKTREMRWRFAHRSRRQSLGIQQPASVPPPHAYHSNANPE